MLKTNPNCPSLLKKIHNKLLEHEKRTIFIGINLLIVDFFLFIGILVITRSLNSIYNSWNGPFVVNATQLRDHLQNNNDLLGDRAIFSFRSLLFQPEYLQVELGPDSIELNYHAAFEEYLGARYRENLLYTYHEVIKPNIESSGKVLWIKLSTMTQANSNQQYAYRFESFSIKTLSCLAKHIGMYSQKFSNPPKGNAFIHELRIVYKRSPRLFNRYVIRKCGILLGYLYKPSMTNIYRPDNYNPHTFTEHVRIFDAAGEYSAKLSYAFMCSLICLFLYNHYTLIKKYSDYRQLLTQPINVRTKQQLKRLALNSIVELDNLLLQMPSENNYRNTMFIVRSKYLIMMLIDFDETSPDVLQRFHEETLFRIIDIHTIVEVHRNRIGIHNMNDRYNIDFPVNMKHNFADRANWLQKRLVLLSVRCRFSRVHL